MAVKATQRVQPKERVYDNYEELVTAVAKQTRLDEPKVRAVLSAAFPSTRAWVLAEANKAMLAANAKILRALQR